MGREQLPPGLTGFLKDAKLHTYAGSNTDTTVLNPCLEQSTQLEWRSGDWFYRDIYFGQSHFSGIETVFLAGQPVWSMVYSGGVLPNIAPDKTTQLYAFLRAALRKIPDELPVQGIPSYVNEWSCHGLVPPL